MASKNDKNFEIKKIYLFGIKNPTITFDGEKNVDVIEPKIYEDGTKLEYFKNPVGSKRKFSIYCVLNKSFSKIKVFDKKGNLIYTYNNFLLRRIITTVGRKISKPFSSVKALFVTLGKGISFFWRKYHFLVPPKMWKKYFNDFKNRVRHRDTYSTYNPYNQSDYNKWLLKVEEQEKEEKIINLKYKPLISLLIPVYNIGKKYLFECIDSILNQTYQNFEICLVDDCSTNEETKEALKELETRDERIKVKYRKENGHISRTTNDALAMAKGEFVGLIDNDDTITPNALYEVVKVLNKDKTIDMIYSDEDKLDLNGRRCEPTFKSDFAPDSLLSNNYICHFTVLRKSIMDKIGGERVGFEGAQDFDLFLRFTEKTDKIYHIPKILYHWRMVKGSTSMVIDNKSYALERGRKAVEEALERRHIKGTVSIAEGGAYYYIEYEPVGNPMISIIIPTRNHSDITKKCIDSIYEKSTYKNFEVVLVDNQSDEQALFDLIEKYKKEHKNFRVVEANMEFNYSRINNTAVDTCKSDYILLLNNDTEVITPNWLELLVGYASQKHVGAVGAKLLYPDNTIQHGGVILGIGGIANHAFLNYDRDELVFGARISVPYNYAAVTAACLMVSKKKYKEVGGLEEDLKVAFNDVDFNIKLLKKGYYNVFVPMVELYHHESKSRGLDDNPEKYQRFLFENEYMHKKWDDIIKNDPFYNPNYSLDKAYRLDK